MFSEGGRRGGHGINEEGKSEGYVCGGGAGVESMVYGRVAIFWICV